MPLFLSLHQAPGLIPAATGADLAGVAGRVTVTTSPDDGVNLIGIAAHKALRLAGVDPARLRFRYHERPFPAISEFADGAADVLIHEAILSPHWQRITAKRPVRYLPWGEEVLTAFAAAGWPSATVDAGYPEECIDCGACLPECPVDAIVAPDESPDPVWVADNAAFFTRALPGRRAPLGSPGGAEATGPAGADTPLAASWARAGGTA